MSDGERWPSYGQCAKTATGKDSDGFGFCRIHDPAYKEARAAARSAKWKDKQDREERSRIAYGLSQASVPELEAELERRRREAARILAKLS